MDTDTGDEGTTENILKMNVQFRVTNNAGDEATREVLLRIFAEEKPDERATAAVPGLEDYYLYAFGMCPVRGELMIYSNPTN